MESGALSLGKISPEATGQPLADRLRAVPDGAKRSDEALEVREAFTSFVGQTFFGQMIKAMRTSLGKPAYFHGGQAEEIFRSQLDQTLAEEMTSQSASRFTGPMFRQQFPRLSEALNETSPSQPPGIALDDLGSLRRR